MLEHRFPYGIFYSLADRVFYILIFHPASRSSK